MPLTSALTTKQTRKSPSSGERGWLPALLFRRSSAFPAGIGRAGFSLLEMMIVVAIIALMALVVVPSVGNLFRVSLASSMRELAGTIREAYNSAVITGKVHRVAYDIKKNEYWVEVGAATAMLDTKKTREREEQRKKFEKSTDKPREATDDGGFALAGSVTKKHLKLPTGVTFEDLLTEKGGGEANEALTEGIAYTHFFPNGQIEQTIIHLKDNAKHQVTLVVLPLVGQTDLYERYVKPEEVFGNGK